MEVAQGQAGGEGRAGGVGEPRPTLEKGEVGASRSPRQEGDMPQGDARVQSRSKGAFE